jgi:hypothetical protein
MLGEGDRPSRCDAGFLSRCVGLAVAVRSPVRDPGRERRRRVLRSTIASSCLGLPLVAHTPGESRGDRPPSGGARSSGLPPTATFRWRRRNAIKKAGRSTVRPAREVFGCGKVNSPPTMGQRRGDAEHVAVEVHVSPADSQDLAEPHTGAEGEDHRSLELNMPKSTGRRVWSSSRSISSCAKARLRGEPQKSPIRSARSRSGSMRTWSSSARGAGHRAPPGARAAGGRVSFCHSDPCAPSFLGPLLGRGATST